MTTSEVKREERGQVENNFLEREREREILTFRVVGSDEK